MNKSLILATVLLLAPAAILADMNAANQALKSGDLARAAAEFLKLAEQGDAKAQSHLGYMYYAGEGVPQSYEEAVKWYQKAAVQGDRDAQYNLAVAYAFGEGTPQNYNEAAIWYRRAADQGHPVAQYSLGISYAYGEGVPQDEKQAAEWFMKSAQGGYENAQVMVASLYHTGDGLPKDYAKAVEWYRKAADRGNAVAQYNLGTIYRAGKGVTKNMDEALKWMRLSAAQGYEAAKTELASLERAQASGAKPPVAAPKPAETTTATTAPAPVAQPVPTPTPVPETKPEQVAETKSVSVPAPTLAPSPAPTPTAITAESTTSGPESEKSAGGLFSGLKKIFSSEGQPATATATPEPGVTQTPEPTPTTPEPVPAPVVPVVDAVEVEKSEAVITEVAPPVVTPPPRPEVKIDPVDTVEVEKSSAVITEVPKPVVEEREPVAFVPAPAPEPEAASVPQPEMTPEPDQKSGGFFSRLFSSDNKTDASSPDKQPVTETTPPETDSASVKTYAEGVTPSDQQLTREAEETPSVSTATKPEALSLEKITPDPATTTSSTATETGEPGGISKFFGGLFGSDDTEDDPALTEAVTDTVEVETTGPGITVALATEPPAPEINPAASAADASIPSPPVTTIVTDTETGLGGVDGMQIAKSEMQNYVQTMEPEVEAAIKTTVTSSIDTLKSRAVSGDAEAQLQLGSQYYRGDGLEQDHTQAYLWYRRAALQGNTEAQYQMGNLHLMGEGISQNDNEARNWYEKAAAQGHAGAQRNLENLQKTLPAVTASTEPPEATVVADAATEQVETEKESKGLFGKLFGSDEKENEDTAETDSAQTPPATVAAFERERPKAINPVESDYQRGIAYTYGEGVPQNYGTAFKYFESAAERGYPQAQYQMGVAYANGYGVDKDPAAALEWFEKAAQQGITIAQRSLGNMHLHGEGVPVNKALALAWYSILADQGNVLDIHRRDALQKELADTEIREAERLHEQLAATLSTASTKP